MNTGLLIQIIIIAAVVILVVVAVLIVRNKIRNFSRQMFGTDSLVEGYKNQTHEYNETPLSLHAMTDIYLPQILRDFPEFEYEAYKNKAESLLRSYFTAVSTKRQARSPKNVRLL